MTLSLPFPSISKRAPGRRARGLFGMFSARGVKNLNTAYFPGTGPRGRVCLSCRFFAPEEDRPPQENLGRCNKVRILTSAEPRVISARLASCKYYEEAAWRGEVRRPGESDPTL